MNEYYLIAYFYFSAVIVTAMFIRDKYHGMNAFEILFNALIIAASAPLVLAFLLIVGIVEAIIFGGMKSVQEGKNFWW